MAFVVGGCKNQACGDVVHLEIRFHGIVVDAFFRCPQLRVGGLDPACAVPSAAHQAGFEVGLFGGGGFASLVVPYGDGPIITGGGLQFAAFVGHVNLTVGHNAAGAPHLFGAGRIGEYGDFVCRLFHSALVAGVHAPAEHRFFHINGHGVLHGLRAQPFHFQCPDCLYRHQSGGAPKCGPLQERKGSLVCLLFHENVFSMFLLQI